jgi:hypothetical protein
VKSKKPASSQTPVACPNGTKDEKRMKSRSVSKKCNEDEDNVPVSTLPYLIYLLDFIFGLKLYHRASVLG